ncbi:MAG TPA: hypothetical protein VLE22_18635 [Bryobacteraceae bacterium]|nr:hypothetical protein [Bryobacteraceae bacterium]
MIKLLSAILGVFFIPNAGVAADPCSARQGALVELKALKANPQKFNGKTIRVSGMLRSGHVAVSLQNGEGLSVRIRARDEVKSRHLHRACEDTLYQRLWALSESPRTPEDEVLYLVDAEGVVRTLKDRSGKPAKEFSVFGQWPVELIVTRVLSIHENGR